jgi:hypothetical protein
MRLDKEFLQAQISDTFFDALHTSSLFFREVSKSFIQKARRKCKRRSSDVASSRCASAREDPVTYQKQECFFRTLARPTPKATEFSRDFLKDSIVFFQKPLSKVLRQEASQQASKPASKPASKQPSNLGQPASK